MNKNTSKYARELTAEIDRINFNKNFFRNYGVPAYAQLIIKDKD